jgi:hypothetical protein
MKFIVILTCFIHNLYFFTQFIIVIMFHSSFNHLNIIHSFMKNMLFHWLNCEFYLIWYLTFWRILLNIHSCDWYYCFIHIIIYCIIHMRIDYLWIYFSNHQSMILSEFQFNLRWNICEEIEEEFNWLISI